MKLKQNQKLETQKNRFGSKNVEAFYDDCLKTINEIDVGYFYKVTTKRNVTDIVVCNMFKLRFNGHNLSYYKYLFKSKRWQNIEHSKDFYTDYTINHLSLIENTSTLYKRFLTDAVVEIMYRKKSQFVDKHNQLSFETIKNIVLAKLLKKAAKPNAPQLGQSFMRMLWDTLVNKDVYSFCMRIYLKPPTLKQYLHVAKMPYDALCRLRHENPNLLPVLAFFEPDDINQYDLFSKKRWVKSNDIGDVDESAIILPIQFTTNASWHFFKQLSSRLVKSFLYNARAVYPQSHTLWVIDLLMKIPHIRQQKVYIIHFMMDFLFQLVDMGHEPLCYRISDNQRTVFINAIMAHILLIQNRLTSPVFRRLFVYRNFKTKDIHGEYRTFNHQAKDILDYLVANQHVQLRKNKTFNRLLQDTRQWEHAVSMQKNQTLMNITWHKSLPDTVINDYLVKELNTGFEVYQEGQEMHHCIQTYIEWAQDNQYKIFSITTLHATNQTHQGINQAQSTERERATLGAVFDDHNNQWTLEQVRGVCNANISEAIHEVSKQIITELNKTAKIS